MAGIVSKQVTMRLRYKNEYTLSQNWILAAVRVPRFKLASLPPGCAAQNARQQDVLKQFIENASLTDPPG
jgi:hypothetical protein